MSVTRRNVLVLGGPLTFVLVVAAARIQAPSVFDAILAEAGQRTPGVSTVEIRKI